MPGTTLDAQYWKRIDALLEVALGLPAVDREPWLANLGAEYDAHKPMIRRLLARSGVESDGFMGRPVSADLMEDASDDLVGDHAGEVVGPYRLVDPLGRGGMGTVWRAERADGSLKRQVALKLPRAGWSPGLADRLRRECEVLSTLEHPNIARLYDAGLAANGRPYLAMELVEGMPIDRYCQSRSLDVRGRLAIFLQVADAIAYAHARLVVHRDLKPANILVDAGGLVHVVDFGVAKVLGDRDGVGTALTRLAGRAFTPDYASPEQIRGLPITIASDVYSLGVLLYELLAGRRPYRLQRESPAALEEAILEADVAPASSRAADRATAKTLRGDVDTILGKALRKEPVERYPTVEAFAQDVRLWLDGRPIAAQPLSLGYLALKLVRRHRAWAAATSVAVVAIVAGILAVLHQSSMAEASAIRAARERDRAVQELQFSEATEEFLRFLLSEQSAKPVPAPELLRRAEKAVGDQYAGDPGTRARVGLVLADLLGESQDYERAEAVLRMSLAEARRRGDTEVGDQVECTLGGLLGATGRGSEALPLFEAIALRHRDAPPEQTRTIETCHIQRGAALRNAGKYEEAIAETRAALDRIGTSRPGQEVNRIFLETDIANALTLTGRIPEGLALFEKNAEKLDRIGRSNTSAGIVLANNLVYHLSRAGQLKRAEAAYRRAVAAGDLADLPAAGALGINIARTLLDMGRPLEARAVLEPALALKVRQGDKRGAAFGQLTAAAIACTLAERVRCASLLAQSEERLRPVVPPSHSAFAYVELVRGLEALDRGRTDEAIAALAKAIERFDSARDRSPVVIRAHAAMALARQRAGDPADAARHAARAVEIARDVTQGLPSSEWVGSALLVHAQILRAQGDRAAAIESADAAVAQLAESVGSGSALHVAGLRLAADLRSSPAS